MRNQNQGKVMALLFVLLLVLSGCSGRREAYFSAAGETGALEVGAGTAVFAAEGMTAAEAGKSAGNDVIAAEAGSSAGNDVTAAGAGNSAGNDVTAAGAGEPAGDAMPAAETEESAGYVYVCGAVARPGVYPLGSEMRVFEALELAGGFTEEADREWLNQAQVLADGERLYVYSRAETKRLREQAEETAGALPQGSMTPSEPLWAETMPGQPRTEAASDAAPGKINLNRATKEELMTLPGIGEAKAEAVIAYREEHGAFSAIEEIQKIRGIKGGVFAKIKEQITV